MKRLLFGFLALTACNTDFFDAEGIGNTTWQPNVAIPIGYAHYTLEELLNNADSLVDIREDENNFITLVYEQELLSESAEEFLRLVDQSFEETFNLNIPPPYPDPVVASGVSFRSEETIFFDYNTGINESLTSATFASGILDIEVNSTIKAEVQAQLKFPEVLLNGEPLVVDVNLDNYGGASITRMVQKELEDFKIDLTNNQLEAVVILDITSYGAPISSSDMIRVRADLHDMSFESFYGNVGTRSLQIEEERFTYEIFKELGVGEVYFSDPKLIFTVENSFGLPVGIDFSGIYAEDPENGNIDLTGEVVDNVQLVQAPEHNQVGETITSVISINKDNSNFEDIVSALPVALNMPLKAVTNPNGETQNFVVNTSSITVNMSAELPLDLRVAGLQNSIELEFESGDIDFMDSGKLRINIENSFPLQGKVRILFKNAQGVLLEITPNNDFDHPLFDAAPVDQNGFVTSPKLTQTDIALNKDQLNKIEQATEVEVEIQLNTTDAESGQNVKLLSNYDVNVNLGIESTLEVDLNEE